MISAFHLLDTGYCRTSEHLMIRGGARRQIDCHALVALIHHERKGWLLFDTGYAPRLAEATARLPYAIYGWILPAQTSPEQAVVGQLSRFGLTASDIRYVVASHFHPDHACGLRDFSAACFVCDPEAYADIVWRSGFGALRRGFLPALMPSDFAAHAPLPPHYAGPELPGVGRTYDLFRDGTLLLVPLPGHARGQIGMFAPETPIGAVFLVADGAYMTRSIRENLPPGATTDLFAHSPRAVVETVNRLHQFHRARPDVMLVPTHCPEAFARLGAEGSGGR